MDYREIISWANNKLEQEERQNQFDIDMIKNMLKDYGGF